MVRPGCRGAGPRVCATRNPRSPPPLGRPPLDLHGATAPGRRSFLTKLPPTMALYMRGNSRRLPMNIEDLPESLRRGWLYACNPTDIVPYLVFP